MTSKIDAYADFAVGYSEMVKKREQAGIEQELIMPHFLKLLGDVSGLTVLDAGCGRAIFPASSPVVVRMSLA